MRFFSYICAIFALSACGTFEFPGVYRIAVEQGNVLTQEKVDQLKPGMSKEQVRFLLGSPIIEDAFHSERWDYVYHLVKQDYSREKKNLSLTFTDDALSAIDGTITPQAKSGANQTPTDTTEQTAEAETL